MKTNNKYYKLNEQVISLNTRIPIMYYLWIIISVSFFIYFLLNNMIFWGSCFYTAIISLLFFITFSRYSCRVFIRKDELVVHYLFPSKSKISIKLETINNYSVEKGFYDWLSDTNRADYFLLCYDSISIKGVDNKKIEFRVNTRIGDFKKIRKALDLTIKLKNLK
jgi:hypothetical protein